MRRSYKAVVTVAGTCVLAGAAVALAVSGGDPRQPTRSHSPLVSIGQPIAPYRAGKPPKGWMEMRVKDPDGAQALALLYYEHTRISRGRPVHVLCADVGDERRLRRSSTRRDNGCLPADPDLQDGLALRWGSGFGGRAGLRVQGRASAEVRRVVVKGPGGTYEVPLARHRSFLLLYSARATGKLTLTAHLRDGGTRYYEIPLRPEFPPGRGAVAARDPGGLAAWRVTAEVRSAGAREGQTCAQFVRALGEFGAPLCGDLAANAVFADATRWGPRRTRGPYGPGPKSPKRLIVWGAVATSVRGVRIIGRRGTRRLALSPVGRALIAVYPAGTDPRSITLEVTLADATVQRHVGPRRLNAIALE